MRNVVYAINVTLDGCCDHSKTIADGEMLEYFTQLLGLHGQRREHRIDCAGQAADLVLLGGNPAEKIEKMGKVELVFKDGVGFDPAKLIQSATELVGLR